MGHCRGLLHVALLAIDECRGPMQTELDKVVAALREFYARETFLLENDLGERTLTHRLAVYLEKQFPGWEVDCEYDRLGERTLRLPHGTIVSTDDHLGKSVYPDIVVHQREIPNNLLAIEVRKASQPSAAGTRPAQAARADRPASVVRLLDRGAFDSGQKQHHRVGGVCRRRTRRAPVALAVAAPEGCPSGQRIARYRRATSGRICFGLSVVRKASVARRDSRWVIHLATRSNLSEGANR